MRACSTLCILSDVSFFTSCVLFLLCYNTGTDTKMINDGDMKNIWQSLVLLLPLSHQRRLSSHLSFPQITGVCTKIRIKKIRVLYLSIIKHYSISVICKTENIDIQHNDTDGRIWFLKRQLMYDFVVASNPTGGKLSLEFKFHYFAHDKFATFCGSNQIITSNLMQHEVTKICKHLIS